MATQRLIVAIGRIERALSRLEQLPAEANSEAVSDLAGKHEQLKAETRAVISDLDAILAGQG